MVSLVKRDATQLAMAEDPGPPPKLSLFAPI